MVALRSLAYVLLVARLITGTLNQREDTDRNNLYKNNGLYGPVVQLGEHLICTQKVVCSIHIWSTNMGESPSWLGQQTVNLPVLPSLVQIQPHPPARNSAKVLVREIVPNRWSSLPVRWMANPHLRNRILSDEDEPSLGRNKVLRLGACMLKNY